MHTKSRIAFFLVALSFDATMSASLINDNRRNYKSEGDQRIVKAVRIKPMHSLSDAILHDRNVIRIQSNLRTRRIAPIQISREVGEEEKSDSFDEQYEFYSIDGNEVSAAKPDRKWLLQEPVCNDDSASLSSAQYKQDQQDAMQLFGPAEIVGLVDAVRYNSNDCLNSASHTRQKLKESLENAQHEGRTVFQEVQLLEQEIAFNNKKFIVPPYARNRDLSVENIRKYQIAIAKLDAFVWLVAQDPQRLFRQVDHNNCLVMCSAIFTNLVQPQSSEIKSRDLFYLRKKMAHDTLSNINNTYASLGFSESPSVALQKWKNDKSSNEAIEKKWSVYNLESMYAAPEVSSRERAQDIFNQNFLEIQLLGSVHLDVRIRQINDIVAEISREEKSEDFELINQLQSIRRAVERTKQEF